MFAETLLGKPLFPGRDAVSQLHLITDLVGKPPASVISRISNQKARNFLHELPNKPPRQFEHKFRNADPQALDLLKQLLAFDPSDRPTAAQALEHPYFKGLPAVASTDCPPISSQQFEFEQHQLTEQDVRNLIYIEALNYHPNVLAQYSAGSCRLPMQMHQYDADIDNVKRQFLMVEDRSNSYHQASSHYPSGARPAGTPPAMQPPSWSLHQQLHAYRPGDSAQQQQQAHHNHHNLHHVPSHHHHSAAAAHAERQHQEAVAAAAAAAGGYSNPPSPYDPLPAAPPGIHHADAGAYASGHILATEC